MDTNCVFNWIVHCFCSLTKHATETAEKKRQAEIEAAKLKVLSESNRKSLNDLLEERLQHYMHITTPAIEEVSDWRHCETGI